MEVVKAYMAGDKSTAQLADEYNITKITITEWAKNMMKNANIKISLLRQ